MNAGSDPSSPLIISVSGLRGVVGQSLTPEVALQYAAAFAAELPPGPIVVTRDGRTTGAMIADAVRSALAACGRLVLDGGIAATPTTGILVVAQHAAGGLQISASHNPPEYNGIKLFHAEGRVVSASAGQRVADRFAAFAATAPPWVRHEALGAVRILSDATGEHLRRVLSTVDVARIRDQRFRVLLDANHGSGSLLGKPLLESLGCQVAMLGGDPDGRFAHPPEPTAENLQSVLGHIARDRFDVGFCQDPDADRLAVIDGQGRYLGEEATLALCVDHVLRKTPGPVVTNCSTSRMTADLAERYGVPFYQAAVGEANVVEAMLRHDAVLGGEGNGGVIDPRVGLVRDSFAGMALVLDAMAARRMTAAALADELPQYAICKARIALPPDRGAVDWNRLAAGFPDAQASRLDGLRLDWPDGTWLLVRASNTEPLVRAVAEAADPRRAADLCAAAEALLRA